MKISTPLDNPVATSGNAASLATKSGPAASALLKAGAAKTPQAAGVAVSVSSMTRSLEVGQSVEVADVDMAKVNAVKQSIAEGSFKVNPEAIADKLLSNAQEMLQRSRV